LSNDAGSINALSRLSVNGFTGFSVDASFVTAAGETVPAFVTRSANGSVIGFNFVNSGSLTTLNPGKTSTELVLHTNATQFAASTAAIIGGPTASAATYMPVPEPSSLILGLAGLSALLVTGWRRRSARRSA
jgi:hypothetical protein